MSHQPLTQTDILTHWVGIQKSRNFHMLKQETTVEFEYKKTPGPRTMYGFLRFHCKPADGLSFYRVANWPEPSVEYYMDSVVMQGLVEGLFMGNFYPYSGCHIECVEIGWHEIHSVPVSYYYATLGAMQELRTKGSWDITPRKNSSNS